VVNYSGDAISRDLTETSPKEILDGVGDIDVVIGGPPSKGFSKTNQKVDLGRNNLVIFYAKIVLDIKREVFVTEDVRQITTKYDDVLNQLYSTLNENHSISHRLLDSADYGVPQHRIRAFVIGIRDYDGNPKFPSATHEPDSSSGRTLVSAGEDLKDTENPGRPEDYMLNSKNVHLLDNIPSRMNYSFYTEN
jgi:DNA (cytosine-5)-methyltransferase 1